MVSPAFNPHSCAPDSVIFTLSVAVSTVSGDAFCNATSAVITLVRLAGYNLSCAFLEYNTFLLFTSNSTAAEACDMSTLPSPVWSSVTTHRSAAKGSALPAPVPASTLKLLTLELTSYGNVYATLPHPVSRLMQRIKDMQKQIRRTLFVHFTPL